MIEYNYSIKGDTLTRVDRIKDLGIVFDQKVTFISQIEAVMRKTKRLVAFLNRNTGNFRDRGVLKALYFSIVRSMLEYGSLIWYPTARKHIKALERVQERLLPSIYNKIVQYYPVDIEYGELLLGFEIGLIWLRNRVAALIFQYDLIHGRISDKELLSELNFHVSTYGGRSRTTFYIPRSRSRASHLSIARRAQKRSIMR